MLNLHLSLTLGNLKVFCLHLSCHLLFSRACGELQDAHVLIFYMFSEGHSFKYLAFSVRYFE